ncbi:MAG: outer membrane beta-barrel protein [Candidatus Zixiibacteriota bacterium]
MYKILAFFLIFFMLINCFGLSNTKAFEIDKMYIGPSLGFVDYGNSLALGGSFEYAIDERIGLTADLAFSRFEEHWSRYDIDYTFIGLLFGGAYHIRPDEELDPYLKFSLGYFDFSYEAPYTGAAYSAAYARGLGYGAQIGIRYILNENMLIKVGLGFPFFFTAGLDFSID